MPAFATTIRKGQGPEYPAVAVPLLTRHDTGLARNRLHTGATRGRQRAVPVGQRRAIAMAVRGGHRRRDTGLAERLGAPASAQDLRRTA